MLSNQKGFAPLIILLVVGIIAVVGFFLFKQAGTRVDLPDVGIGQKVSEADFAFIEDPILKKHFVTQANVADYRTTGTSPGSGLKQVSEVQIRGNSWNRREVESNGATEVKNTITIGDTMYLKDYSDNKWWKQIMKFEETEVVDEEVTENTKPKDFKEEYSDPEITYKSLGKENCGLSASSGLTCYKYQQYFSKDPEFKRTFWFDDKDYLLRKEQGGFGEFISTIEYSYDGIDITAPSPTKDVPEGKSIYDYTSAGYNRATPDTPTYDQLQEAIPTVNLDEMDYQYPEGY